MNSISQKGKIRVENQTKTRVREDPVYAQKHLQKSLFKSFISEAVAAGIFKFLKRGHWDSFIYIQKIGVYFLQKNWNGSGVKLYMRKSAKVQSYNVDNEEIVPHYFAPDHFRMYSC